MHMCICILYVYVYIYALLATDEEHFVFLKEIEIPCQVDTILQLFCVMLSTFLYL